MGAAAILREEGTLSWLVRWTWKWKWCVLVYFVIFVGAWWVIERRAGPVWRDGKIADRIPLFVALYNWVCHPDRMQYVATATMQMNHQLHRSDFTFPTKSEAFYNYFPRVDDIKGKYLKKGITAGEAILLTNLSPDPIIDPQPDTYIVNIRVTKPTIPKGFVEAKSTIVISAKDSTDKLEGTVLSSTWEEAPSQSPTKSSDITKTSAAAPSPGATAPPAETAPSPKK
jgi:hypothetical protein